MTTDNKTLADVQPGGRVRLGDQAERAQFEAWAEPRKHTLTRWGDSPGDVKPLFVSEVAGNYISPAAQAGWEAWQHLSAQPSPGGQDALRVIAERLRGAGANLPAPPITGTIEGSMVTGLSIALALVEDAITAGNGER